MLERIMNYLDPEAMGIFGSRDELLQMIVNNPEKIIDAISMIGYNPELAADVYLCAEIA